MNRTVALAVISIFAVGGLALAWWGWTEVRASIRAIAACEPVAFDGSAFWFLGLAALLFFPALAVLPDRAHRHVVTLATATFLIFPALGFWVLNGAKERQGYVFEPELGLFKLQAFSGVPGANCQTG